MLNSSEPMNIDLYVHLILVSANRAMSERVGVVIYRALLGRETEHRFP